MMNQRGRLKSGKWWALVRGPKALPVLFETREAAIVNRDPDEYLVQVQVSAANLNQRLQPWSRAKR